MIIDDRKFQDLKDEFAWRLVLIAIFLMKRETFFELQRREDGIYYYYFTITIIVTKSCF